VEKAALFWVPVRVMLDNLDMAERKGYGATVTADLVGSVEMNYPTLC